MTTTNNAPAKSAVSSAVSATASAPVKSSQVVTVDRPSKSVKDFGTSADFAKFRKFIKGAKEIGLTSQKAAMYIVRKLVGEANFKKEPKVIITALKSFELVREVTEAPAPVFVRDAFRRFFREAGIPLNGDSMKLETLRKRQGDLEALLKADKFPVVIEEGDKFTSNKAKPEKTAPTAGKLVESLLKKLTGEHAEDYAGSAEVANLVAMIVHHRDVMVFVRDNFKEIEESMKIKQAQPAKETLKK